MKIIDSNGQQRECVSVEPDKKFPGYVKANFESKIRKGFEHSEWYPMEEFYKNNPKLKPSKVIKDETKEEVGVVTIAGPKYLQDITKNWKKNMFSGIPVWISRGKGESQQRIVVNNDKNKLYIDKAWKIIPNKTSQYVISFNVQENIEAQGNTLPDIKTKDLFEQMIKKAKKSVD